MKKEAFFVILAVALLSGCATFEGIREDFRVAKSKIFSDNVSASAPRLCERVYQRGGEKPYKDCLVIHLRENLSTEDVDSLYYGKTLPQCRRLFRNEKARSQEYRGCQVDAWADEEASRLVRWRKDIDRRDLSLVSRERDGKRAMP